MNVRKRFGGVDASHEHYKWWALSCTSLGMLLVATNSGTLIISLPDLERALGTSLLELVWVTLAYMISSTVLVLTAGRLSDLFGRKTAFVGAFAIFGLASLGAGFAADGTQLILWRIVQGIGGAFIFANGPALVTDAFPRDQLGLAMGTVPTERRGVAAGARTMLQNTGAVISIAFVLAIVTNSIPKEVLFAIFSGLASGLSSAQLDPFIHNMHEALWVLAATSVLGAGVSLLRPKHVTAAAEPPCPPAEAIEEALAEEVRATP